MKRKSARPERSKSLTIPCTQEEFDTIKGLWRQTMSRKFSEYARKVLQSLPVEMTYRNLSVDSLIGTINETREELRRLIDSTALSKDDKERLTDVLQQIKQLFYQIADICIQK